jgi:hypothetical protein
LHLLERQPEREAQFLLRHAKNGAAHPDTAANMLVDRIRRFGHSQCLHARNLNGAAVRSNLSN